MTVDAGRRCSYVLMTLGAAAHHGFELGAGAGLMLQREVGLPVASGLWVAGFSALAVVAWRGSSRWDGVLSFATGANVAAVVVHFTLWPWRWRYGLPMLTSAEGLAHGHLPAYNAILLTWGAAGTAAALCPGGTTRSRVWVLVGLLVCLPLRRHARRHFDWVRDQAHRRPAWWNRALQPPPPP